MPIAFGPASALVSLQWETANTRSGNAATVLGFENVTDSVAGASALANTVATAWIDNLQEWTDNSWQLGVVRVETLGFSIDHPVDELGTENMNGPPSNVTILDSKSAAGKGPRNRGRNYWPALFSEAEVDERGILLSTRIDEINPAMGAFYADIIASGVSLAIPQSDVPGQASEPQVPWPIVVSRGIQAFVATQRRRVR